jgi:hypothetical protein
MDHARVGGTLAAGGRRLAAVLALALLGSLLASAAPAQAGSSSVGTTFVSKPIAYEHGGTKFKVRVTAFDFGGGEQMFQIEFFQQSNPDGTGPLSGRRSIVFMNSATFKVSGKTLGSGQLALDPAKVGNRANWNMTWNPGKLADKTGCQGRVIRNGAFEGTGVFQTGEEKLGKITLKKLPGKVTRNPASCLPGYEPTTCPPAGHSIYSWTGTRDFNASKYGKKARIYAGRSEGQAKGWGVYESVSSTFPAEHVTLNAKLGNGDVKGAKGTFVSGQSNFTGTGSPDTTPATSCKGGKQYTYTGRPGTLANGLVVNFILGSYRPSGDASASRTTVTAA